MPRTLAIILALALAAQATAGPAARPLTDANIVTAIDASDSVSGAEMRLQLAGLAAAMREPEILAAIRGGVAGRVGVAMFVWHERQFEVVPWTLVASAQDAEAVALAIEARLTVAIDEEARRGTPFFIGRLTDVSKAIDHARELLDAAPFAGARAVVNVIGNGTDNMGEAAEAARDRLLASGATVNGVVLGAAPSLLAYFRAEVAGGPAAFVMPAEAAGTLTYTMRRKFLQDLIAATPGPGASL
jgi:hypothetical protein